MKIIIWNTERLKSLNKADKIIAVIDSFNADIIILTETHDTLNPTGNYYIAQTAILYKGYDNIEYRDGERRVTVYSKYSIITHNDTYDKYTAVCIDISTPDGDVTLYSTITGVFGGKGWRFKQDFADQLKDFDALFKDKNIIIAGDLNTTFSGYAYPSKIARQQFNNAFKKYELTCLTAGIDNNVDHIVMSHALLKNKNFNINVFNTDKLLSDHIGICIEIY